MGIFEFFGIKKDKRPYKPTLRTHGTVFRYEVVPTELEVTCYNCSLPFKHTFELSPSQATQQIAYCPICEAPNNVHVPSADEHYQK